MLEVLFSCDISDNQLYCSAWDYRTGTNLMSYKGSAGVGNVQQHSLCILKSEYVLAANSTKPILHVWPINNQEQISAVRFVVPGRVNAMILSPDGLYLVAGIQETLFLWHLGTGRMINTISKHYQPINCLRFTNDGSHFISAGQDGGVLVWNFTRLLGSGEDNQTPVYSFSDHGLPVTDAHIGAGGIRSYLFTVSLDRTCKIYDLSSGNLLLSVVFSEGLKSVTTNALETAVYVGSCSGNIYEFHTDSIPRTKEYHMEKDFTNKFVGHVGSVNCLAISVDGQTLVSGGEDQQIRIWHIASRQLLKTLHHKGAITNILLRLTNPAIFNPEHKQPLVFGGNLKRMIESAETEEEQIIEILVSEPVDLTGVRGESRATNLRNAYAETVSTNHTNDDKTTDEIEKLRAEVDRLKRINKQLYVVSSKHILEKMNK